MLCAARFAVAIAAHLAHAAHALAVLAAVLPMFPALLLARLRLGFRFVRLLRHGESGEAERAGGRDRERDVANCFH